MAPPVDQDDVLGLGMKCADLGARVDGIRDEIKLLGAHDAIGSASERKVKDDSLVAARGALLEISVALSMNRIAAGLYREAVEASQDALASSQKIFGEGSVETIVPSLLLAESSLGIGKIAEVEELLSAASWVLVQRAGPRDFSLRARLLCVRGRLQVEQCREVSGSVPVKGSRTEPDSSASLLQAAQRSFAEEAFEASMASGASSIEASAAYFRLGMTALEMESTLGDLKPPVVVGQSQDQSDDKSVGSGKVKVKGGRTPTDIGTNAGSVGSSSDTAMAFFDKVVEIWYKQVAPSPDAPGSTSRGGDGSEFPEGRERAGGSGEEVARNLPRSLDTLSLATVAEAVGMLRQVRDFRLERLGGEHVAYLEARLTLGMCLWAAGAHRAGADECRSVPAAMAAAMEEGHPAIYSSEDVVGCMAEELEDMEDDLDADRGNHGGNTAGAFSNARFGGNASSSSGGIKHSVAST